MSEGTAAAAGKAGTLVLERITHSFGGGRPAVDALTLELRAGELLALVGASGSGKTTTLRIAAGYEQPDEGRVLLDGRDITRVPPQGRGFGMVFQHYALFPHMTVEENVAFGLEARGVRKADRLARARQALDGVGLGGKGRRAVQALSGGEQQRVALARALVIEPRVLLLDEPLSNLDPTLRESTRADLREMLHRLNVTALFVTHDQEDAFAVADRVALLRHGRLLQAGTPETLYDRPASRAVAGFIGRASLLPAAVADGVATIAVAGRPLRVAARADGATLAGGRGMAVLRPEMLALVPDARGASGVADGEVWPGEVRERRFAGGVTVYDVALAGSAEVVEIASSVRDARPGDRVGVRIVADAVAVVGMEEEEDG
ncbi:MAG: ABC transporter ATP-binding protein [Gemmatimonadaceae bacterium]